MIPTREQIDAYSKSDFASVKVERWLRDMYAELQFYASACSDRDGYCAQVRKLRDAIIAIGVAVGASVNDSCTTSFLCEVKGEVESVVGNLRADLDRANTEAALARDAMAKASDPVREEEIKAWREWALGDIADPDLYDDCFVLSRAEIDAAVALMRSAGDGKALLRELREDLEVYPDGIWTAHEVVAKIGLLLAQPAPSNVYSRGRTIAESAEPPTAYYPPAPVEIWPEEMKRQTLVGKFEPAPVEQPAAAVPDHVPDAGKMVPDDTRELVAQLADLFKVHLSCNGGVNRLRSDRAAEIAAKLRGRRVMEKPTTDHLKALGYRLTHSVARGVYIVVRPDGRVVPNSYAMSPTKAWGLARDYIAREIEATTQPKAEEDR